MSSKYYENLIQRVLDNSENTKWDIAVNEWYILSCREDVQASSKCVCGKENLRYLFTIRNLINGNILFPIGSSCIEKFDRNDLKEQLSIYEQMFKLLHAVEENKFITLDYFSRKLLLFLYNQGAFKPTVYNKLNPKNDYDFLLDMFNRRRKPTPQQEKKIRGIIFNSIIPFLRDKINQENLFALKNN